ncbi:hypothetical protein BJY04DRAFT_232653 [Aspergillus karnatakaensis]|uniref:uncharacterized protein n=1 Tax=Aspergillus karnatakaensis TaxID=1810916 RepID=UPI003CCD92C1
MPATLDSLSLELTEIAVWHLFLNSLGDRHSFASYALVSRKFQVAVERILYTTRELSSNVASISAHPWRRKALRSLTLNIALPDYDSDNRYVLEQRREHSANLAAFRNSVVDLWKQLSRWKDKSPGTLELTVTAAAETDEESYGWYHEDDEDNRWLYRENLLALADTVQLPTVACVYSFEIGTSGRPVHPQTVGRMLRSLPDLRSLHLRIAPGQMKNRAVRAQYRVDLALALESPTLSKLEVLGLSMGEITPENHDFSIVEDKDPAYPDGDVLCHAIRKLAQRSLVELSLGTVVISPALFSASGEEVSFPFLKEVTVSFPLFTHDGRWYYTGDRPNYDLEEEDYDGEASSEGETLEGAASEEQSPTQQDSDSEEDFDYGTPDWAVGKEQKLNIDIPTEDESDCESSEQRAPLNTDRSNYLNGDLPDRRWRNRPDPETFNPLVQALTEAALRMPKLDVLRFRTKLGRGDDSLHRDRDITFQFLAPGYLLAKCIWAGYKEPGCKKWRWVVDLGEYVQWEVPEDVLAMMKERVGEDGEVMVRRGEQQ